jgi:hypothetical protein
VVLPPENSDIDEAKTLQLVDSMTKQSGTSDRTFKSALIWCVPDSGRQLCDEARKLLAWEDIQEEASELKLEELQRKQLAENQGKSKRDLREAVWRTYKTVMLLAKDNSIRSIDLGLVHSSADASLVGFIVHRLKQDGDISEGISPKFLVRNWSGAHKEWSTKAVKDAVFASPLFPRLLNGDLIRDTIARGVSNSVLAYVGKTASGGYDPFVFGVSMSPQEVEISDDVFVITAETAEAYKQSLSAPPKPIGTGNLFVAINDQFLAWVKAQPWYTLGRVWLTVGLLVILGITIAIWQYLIAHRPKVAGIKLEVGIVDPALYDNPPAGTSSVAETSVLYLLDVPETSVSIVHCLLRLTNSGEHGINNVRIQIEYPESYLVEEGVVILFEKVAAVLGEPAAAKRGLVKRDLTVLEGIVRASYTLEALRYGETVVVPEPLKVRRAGRPDLQATGTFGPAALTARLARQRTFIDYLRLRVSVFSQESKLESAFDIFSFFGSDEDDLDAAIAAIKEAVWDGPLPEPGYYWNPFGRFGRQPRNSRLEFCAPQFKAELPGRLFQEIPMQPNVLGISRLLLPPVDFRHTDARAFLGSLVMRHRNRGQAESTTTFLSRKPPPA